MESKEFTFKGTVVNGFVMLFVNLLLTIGAIAAIIYGAIILSEDTCVACGVSLFVGGILLLIVSIILWCGFLMLEPNTARVTTWFGKYSGTFTQTGFYWINPFYR